MKRDKETTRQGRRVWRQPDNQTRGVIPILFNVATYDNRACPPVGGLGGSICFKHLDKLYKIFILPMPHAPCPMPHTPCRMPNDARCLGRETLPQHWRNNAQCPMPYKF
ncbi:MAG: hypothetical protein ACHBN1_08815 [Heteroscytonema crispum UTEX LB 1556]